MTELSDDDRPWMPEPISRDDFEEPDGWTNINRAPYDEVTGVIYKRAANVKRVRYSVAAPDSETTLAAYAGAGETVRGWLFSEQQGTEEGILAGRAFRFLQDVELLPGAATAQTSYPDRDTVLYVITGQGRLVHRPSAGSPNIARPLRPFDAALIRAGELYSVVNLSDADPLRMIVLGLTPQTRAFQRSL